VILNHPKTLQRIDEVFVFVASDADGEGVAAFFDGEHGLPLIAADKARVDSLREIAKEIARQSGNKITLCRFSVREELEVIEP
jgi:dihydroorotase-like cyclic amidohydrolase